MTQDERWQKRYKEVVDFIDANHRNPSESGSESGGQELSYIPQTRSKLLVSDKKLS